MAPLVDAYLAWKDEQLSELPIIHPECLEAEEGYTLSLYDVFTLSQDITISRPDTSTSPAIDFMTRGVLTKTPVVPTVGVSIRTLELLHRIRQRKPSLSMEAFARIVADYYMVWYTNHFFRRWYQLVLLLGSLSPTFSDRHRGHV